MDIFDLQGSIGIDLSGFESQITSAVQSAQTVEKALAALAKSTDPATQAFAKVGDSMEEGSEQSEQVTSRLDTVKGALTKLSQVGSPFDKIFGGVATNIQAMQNLREKVSKVAHPISTLKSAVSEMSDKFKYAGTTLKDWQKKADDARDRVKELTEAYRKSAKETGEDSEETKRLAEELKTAIEELKKAQDELNGYGGEMKETEEKTEKAEKETGKFSETLGKVGSAAASAAKALVKVSAGALAAVGAGVAKIAKDSLEGYANYEQLVGGVETLFGAQGMGLEEYAQSVGKSVEKAKSQYDKLQLSQETVLKNAAKAYKTAGLSQNEYMETVTSFSASLIQSLGGDTLKAAEVADRAIVDMADNANKMGTSIEAIQNAYSGFAKGNFTMLDNLKLGYGGTNEEMERLIADAAKMTDVQKKLGITVQEGDKSFANIANAISVVQSKLGITGTTAREAASTIQGSFSTMQSAWQNLLVEMAKGKVAPAFEDITAAVKNADVAWQKYNETAWMNNGGIDTLTSQIEYNLRKQGLSAQETAEFIASEYDMSMEDAASAVKAVAQTYDDFAAKSSGNLTGLSDAFIESIETVANNVIPRVEIILDSIGNLIERLAPIIAEKLPALITNVLPKLLNAATKILTAITTALPSMINALLPPIITGLVQVFQALVQQLPAILKIVSDSMPMLIDAIMTVLPMITQAALDILIMLAKGIAEQIPVLIPTIVDLVIQLADMIVDNLDAIIDAAIEIVLALAYALADPKTLDKLIKAVPRIITKIVDILIDRAPDMIMAAVEIIAVLGSAILDNLPAIFDAGKQILTKLWEGIKSVVGELLDVLAGIGDEMGQQFYDMVHNAIQWGKDLIANFVQGIKDHISNNAVTKAVAGVAETVKDFLGFSEPKKGALSNFHTFAPDMMELYASGIKSNAKLVTGQVSTLADNVAGMMEGMGETDAFSALGDAVIMFVQPAIDMLNAVAYESGKDFISQFVGGMKDGMSAINATLDTVPAIGMSASAANQAYSTYNVSINIDGYNRDPRELAEEIAGMLSDIENREMMKIGVVSL